MSEKKRSEEQIEGFYDNIAERYVEQMEEGILSPAEAMQRLNELKKEKDNAVIGECGKAPKLILAKAAKVLGEVPRGGGGKER